MTQALKIKVIKKGEKKPEVKAPVNETRTKRQAAREMVANVTGWVSDMQARRREETRNAIEQLFGNQPSPSQT